MNIDYILSKFDGVEDDPDEGWLALCPVHGDSQPSLKIGVSNETGRVIFVCRSQDCRFDDIINAVGLTKADVRYVDPTTVRAVTDAVNKDPADATDLAQLDALVTQLSEGFVNSEASNYAWDRWGIDEDMAAQLRLGTTHPVDNHPLMQPQFTRVMGVSVPLIGFDGKVRGLQRRSLFDNDDRWSTLMNPGDKTRAWSRLGTMLHSNGDDYIIGCEGPGDSLTSYAAGNSSFFLRGSSTMIAKSADEIIEHCRDKMIVMAGDDDDAGRKFNKDMGQLLHDAGIDVRILELPEGVGDLTEWRERETGNFSQALMRGLRNAPPFIPPTNVPPIPVPDGDDYAFTDVGNGHRLVDWFKGDFMYSPELGRLVYVGGVWKADNLNLVPREWKKCLLQLQTKGEELVEYGNIIGNTMLVERGERLYGYALRCSNEPKFKHGITHAETDVTVEHSQFDKSLHLLNVANGTINLRNAELLPHRREDMLTHQLDVPYDPDATAPRFEEFLHEIFPNNPELPSFMQTLCGYLVTGEISEQIIVTCHGPGANGKSVFWGAIGSVLRPLVQYTAMSTFEKRQPGSATADLAGLRGARIVMTQESEANQAVSESTLKRVSGGDEIACRQLYKAPMSFMPQFSVVFSLNHLFTIRGSDEGIWRRQVLIPFHRFFEPHERDPDLLVKLIGESPGILKWIVDGARQWYENGLQRPEIVTAATQNFRDSSDELGGFIGSVIEPGHGQVLGAVVMDRYIGWAHEENVRPWSRRALFNGIIERIPGADKKRVSAGMALTGVQLVDGM